MMFTKEQEEAIFTRGEDILVSAGAGAGKTRVLVTRISEMILDQKHPISADSFLVLTFTNAAASEMKERIVKELEERLEHDPQNRYLRQQIRVVKHADISTVHSFCNRMIRTHFHGLDINPAFRIGEEGELKIMKQEAMEQLLEEKYKEGSASFLQFVEAYAQGKDDAPLETMIEEIYDFSRGFPDASRWFAALEDTFSNMMNGNIEENAAISIMIESGKKKGRPILELLEKMLTYFTVEEEEKPEPERYYKAVTEELALLKGIMEAQDYSTIFQLLHEATFVNFSGPKKQEKEWPYRENVIQVHNMVKKYVADLMENDFAKSLPTIIREQKELYPFFQEIVSLVLEFEAMYAQKKKEKNVYDFNDLEHFAIQLLVEGYDAEGNVIPSTYAYEIASQYKAIFVDEYQDTNLTQEMLLTILKQCADAELFVVGDVKQSIYRFRQARPDLFMDRYYRYQEGEGRKIELRDNFRSSPDVLYFANLIFQKWMRESFGGIDYDDTVCLKAGKNGPMKDVRVQQEVMLWQEDNAENFERVLAEAIMIGNRIEELLEEGYKCEDIVVLLRSMKGYGEIMAEYFSYRGIPVLCESQMGYFQAREIQVILNYLAVVDNVFQDIPMASVLLSSIGGFSPSEIVAMKVVVEPAMRSRYLLYDLMHLYLIEGNDVHLQEKVRTFLEQLEEFRCKKQEMLLHELLWDIYEKTGFYEQVLSMPQGEKRRQNLRMLMKKAEEYEKTVYKGLFHFIRYMEQLRTYEIELGSGIAGEGEEAVRIMTIHKSKGLEYPVVFVSHLAKKFNQMDLLKSVLTHPEYGLGLEQVDLERRVHSPSFLKNVIRNRIKKETLEEELRILYVAMTRAQKKLILTGMLSNGKMAQLKENGTTIFYAEQADSFIDWILPLIYEAGEWNEACTIYGTQDLLVMQDRKRKQHRISLQEMLAQAAKYAGDVSVVKNAFSKTYPHQEAIGWKRKYSVSELKKLSMTTLPEEAPRSWDGVPDEEIPKPQFLQENQEPLTRTAYGTMVHKIMELLPFAEITDRKKLFDAIESLFMQFPKIDSFMRKKIYRSVEHFLFSPQGKQLAALDAQGKLYKEYPFTIGLDIGQIYPEHEGEERVVVQGIVDLCAEEPDGLWLIDYKTDRIKEGEESILLDRYRPQMLYYKLALTQIFGKEVKKIGIYSFALQKFLEIPEEALRMNDE